VSDNSVDLHGWAVTADNISLWWARLWLASSLVATRNSVVRIDSSETGFASLELFSSSSAFSGVIVGVFVEFVFSVYNGTHVPRFEADSRVIDFVDDRSDWDNLTVVLATEWWRSTRFQNLAASTGIGFVGSNFTEWANSDFAANTTFANFLETWTFVVVFQVVSESLSFDLSRASVTSDFLFSWTRNIIATVLASSGMATTIETVFVT
jgi:hypothetical protein